MHVPPLPHMQARDAMHANNNAYSMTRAIDLVTANIRLSLLFMHACMISNSPCVLLGDGQACKNAVEATVAQHACISTEEHLLRK
jgi:hypothetical protein